MSGASIRWHIFGDRFELEQTLRHTIAERAVGAIDSRGSFSIVLAGGSTPRSLYADLANLATTNWNRWHIYFSDERCLPLGDPDRNDTMAREVWLNRVNIPATQIHPIPAERGAAAGAQAYGEVLQGIGPFDFVLIGLGEDGHTASLFPGQPIGAEYDAPDALAVLGAPKPPRERVSLSAARLSNAKAVFLLVVGARKRRAVAALMAQENTVFNELRPPNGIDAYADRGAVD